MKIHEILKEKQNEEYKKLDNIRKNKKQKTKDLSFSEYKKMMEKEHIYKRGKGGCLRQVK